MKTTLRLTPNRLEVLIESLDQYVANEEDAADLAYTQNALARLKTAREILDELNAERAALAEQLEQDDDVDDDDHVDPWLRGLP
jgi:hypothetical protein